MEIDDALTYLAGRRNGVLVSQKRDGRPQLSNITYLLRDGVVNISITADRVKYKNLLRDPRASMHVTQDDFWGYVVVEGDVELSPVATTTHDHTVEDLVSIYRALAGEHPDWDEYRRAMVADRRLVVRLRPTHAYGMPGR